MASTSGSSASWPILSSASSSRSLPLILTINCIEDTSFEQQCLAGIASIEHVPLTRLVEAKIPSASVILLHSLSFLPTVARRRLRHWQHIFCLGSTAPSVDLAIAEDLGLRRPVHVDVSRDEEIADTVMALILGLLRRTHILLRNTVSASGWLGSVQPMCRGMRRCRGLVLGIIGRSGSAMYLATRCLAFKMNVLYFDVQEEKGKMKRSSAQFPSAARRMDTLNDLLAASDIISLHCALTDETAQIINADCLQHVKRGAFFVNTGSSQLLDDCAIKQLLIDGTLAGFALDGAEGPQWMEAWVREMPNVLILPKSANYSEEAWMNIREKVVYMLLRFFLGNIVPTTAVSDEDEEENEIDDKQENDGAQESSFSGGLTGVVDEKQESSQQATDKAKESSSPHDAAQESSFSGGLTDVVDEKQESSQQATDKAKESPSPHQGVLSGNTSIQSEGKLRKASKKARKRLARQRSQQKPDDTAGADQALSSSSIAALESVPETSSDLIQKPHVVLGEECGQLLKHGYVIAIHSRFRPALYVSRQKVQGGGGWFLETMSNVTKRDPAAQFLVVSRSKDTVGLRSFTAGGKLLQLNRKREFVFSSYNLDAWESWKIEGGSLQECRLINCRNPLAVLEVRIEIVARVGKEDGVTRWLA